MLMRLYEISVIVASYIRVKFFTHFKSREELNSWQEKQVQKLLKKILPLSLFYQRRFQNIELAQWRKLDVIDKKCMMENFSEFNTKGISREAALAVAFEAERTRDFSPMIDDVTVGLSSGTSGNRGLFMAAPLERWNYAGTILAKALPQSLLTPQRVALFLRANSNLYSSTKRQRIEFKYFDLLESIDAHIQKLNDYQPTMLLAPPSMLRLLAGHLKSGNLKLNAEKIFSIAEVLDPMDKKYIEGAFGKIIHQIYQCTEGFLGISCSHGTLHLNEDIVIIEKEYLDKKSRKFMPIITDMRRTTQPIIRYRLNDILTERETPCPCGSVFTALESIEGRCDDMLYFKALLQEKLIPVFPDFLRRTIMISSQEIEEYLVVQKNELELEITLRSSVSHTQDLEKQVLQSLEALCSELECQIPKINFTHQSKSLVESLGLKKLRRVERRFQPEMGLQ